MTVAEPILPLLVEPAESKEYRRGTCLYHSGDQPDVAFWLYRGRVELKSVSQSSSIIHSPTLLGAERLTEMPCKHTVRVLDRSASVRYIPLAALRAYWQRDGAFRLWLLRLMSGHHPTGE